MGRHACMPFCSILRALQDVGSQLDIAELSSLSQANESKSQRGMLRLKAEANAAAAADAKVVPATV